MNVPASRSAASPHRLRPEASPRIRAAGGREENGEASLLRLEFGGAAHLQRQEGERVLDQEPHQPLGVEDELVAVRLLVPAEQKVRQAFLENRSKVLRMLLT